MDRQLQTVQVGFGAYSNRHFGDCRLGTDGILRQLSTPCNAYVSLGQVSYY